MLTLTEVGYETNLWTSYVVTLKWGRCLWSRLSEKTGLLKKRNFNVGTYTIMPLVAMLVKIMEL